MSESYSPTEIFFGKTPQSWGINNESFPQTLREVQYGTHISGGEKLVVPSPPETLHILGNEECFAGRKVAIIGSREAEAYSPDSVRFTQECAQALAAHNIWIFSGLAIGIDSIAHQATLEAGGNTAAFLPNSFHQILPKGHTRLAQNILAQNGTLITRFHKQLQSPDYKKRNLDLVGCSPGIIIPYGGNHKKYPDNPAKCGAMMTARMAYLNDKPIGIYVPKDGNLSPLNRMLLDLKLSGSDYKGLICPLSTPEDAIKFVLGCQ